MTSAGFAAVVVIRPLKKYEMRDSGNMLNEMVS